MTQVPRDHADLSAISVRHRERDRRLRRRDQGTGPADHDRADIPPSAEPITIRGITVSHRYASQHIRAQKQADTRSLVRSTRKPDPDFYQLIVTLGHCWPSQVLHVGNSLGNDVVGPAACGLRVALVRPRGITDQEREQLPPGALVVDHLRELPPLLGCQTAS